MVANQRIHRTSRPDNSAPISIQEEIADEEEEAEAETVRSGPADVEAQTDVGSITTSSDGASFVAKPGTIFGAEFDQDKWMRASLDLSSEGMIALLDFAAIFGKSQSMREVIEFECQYVSWRYSSLSQQSNEIAALTLRLIFDTGTLFFALADQHISNTPVAIIDRT
ncbi:hypothetical protein [Methylocapsa aurea]|jgi:hypothetical protein|uniref:hypothetical protein n=1 Tax=Methylocapsa aurea TaxID=663610 RepID=UPI003D18F773